MCRSRLGQKPPRRRSNTQQQQVQPPAVTTAVTTGVQDTPGAASATTWAQVAAGKTAGTGAAPSPTKPAGTAASSSGAATALADKVLQVGQRNLQLQDLLLEGGPLDVPCALQLKPPAEHTPPNKRTRASREADGGEDMDEDHEEDDLHA